MEIISPNNVLANAMLRSVDMVRPRLQATNPDRVAFCVGTQINGAPHLGTSLVQTAAFLLAKATKRAFGVDTVVRFSALDNAPYDIQLDPETHHAYHPGLPPPPRIFTPMVLTDTGAKLSKSLIRDGTVPPSPGTHPWMLDVTEWPGDIDSYIDAMVWLVGRMLADPKHFYRSYTTQELDRIMTARPTVAMGVRAREMNLYRRYFDLVATGQKTIEVRVQYPNLRNLKAGDHIRFVCGRDDALTKVKRVTRYNGFEEMLDAEGPANVNPDSPREQQLANIRRIYGPEKEALGVLAIEIELLDPAS